MAASMKRLTKVCVCFVIVFYVWWEKLRNLTDEIEWVSRESERIVRERFRLCLDITDFESCFLRWWRLGVHYCYILTVFSWWETQRINGWVSERELRVSVDHFESVFGYVLTSQNLSHFEITYSVIDTSWVSIIQNERISMKESHISHTHTHS